MKGTFFAPQLVRGFRPVAAVVLVGVGDGRRNHLMGRHPQVIGLPFLSNEWHINFWAIGVALALVVLAELFRHGSKVQQGSAGLD